MNYYKQINIHAAAILLLTWATGFCYSTEKITYSGYTLYRTFPQREQHIAGLRALRAQEIDGIEFWTEPATINRTVDIMVSPDQNYYFTEHLRHSRLPAKRIMNDVGEVIKRTSRIQNKVGRMLGLDDESGTNVSANYLRSDNFYLRYQTYPLIERKLEELASHPAVTMKVAGRSFEGRNLYLIKISTDPKAEKPIIFLDAGHHAREWISHATIIYIMESLVSDRMPTATRQNSPDEFIDNSITERSDNDDRAVNSTGQLKALLDRYDFWFVPVVNPDGYEYTHKKDRLWRKTRSVSNNWCVGVDPNRNYPFVWGGKGTSQRSCDDIYIGPKALSEPETKMIANTILENRDRIKMYISLHSYSQVILLPYGYDRVLPKNYNDMMRVANAGSRAAYSLRGTQYRTGTSAILLYPAAGASDDFAYEYAGVKHSYTIELPDTGNKGFLLPPNEIIPVGQETVYGLAAMVNAMSE